MNRDYRREAAVDRTKQKQTFTEDMPIIPPPEREALEREVSDLVNGDVSRIARLLQVNQSTVSNAFNPYREDRHNPVYNFILHLWAFDQLRPGLADEVLTIVTREREIWTETPHVAKSRSQLTGSIGKE